MTDAVALSALIAEQLADDLACEPADLLHDGLSIAPFRVRPGRRRFLVMEHMLQVATLGRGVVVSCQQDRIAAVHQAIDGVSPTDVFTLPILSRLQLLVERDGQWLQGPLQHAVCRPEFLRPVAPPAGVVVELLQGDDLERLYHEPGFDNALEYDRATSRPDMLAAVATVDGRIAGAAGASADSERFWQIGVDIREPFRRMGIATALVSRATEAIFAAGRTPYYATAIAHLTSTRIAWRLGYRPAWVAAYTRAGA